LASLAFSVTTALAIPASFATEGSGAGQVADPHGVAIEQESGTVFLADRNNNRIDRFAAEGAFQLAWGFGVADGSSKTLQMCTTLCFGGLGAPFEGFGSGQFNEPEGIAVDDSLSTSHGDVYVLDHGNNRVQKFGPEGEFLLMFGGGVNATTKGDVCVAGEACQAGVAGPGPGEFQALGGRSIAIGATGTVYVGDENRVQKFSPTGALEGEIPLAGVGAIENLALDSSKHLYIAASELAGVHEYEESGAEVATPPRDESGERRFLVIAPGPGGELFVNDFRAGRHHIFTYNAAGDQTASFDAGEEAQDGGQQGIGYSENLKALYVLTGMVRVVSPPPPGPFVLIGSESSGELQTTSAALGATINPEGPKATSYHFEYGTSAAYDHSTAEVPLALEPFEDLPASAAITGLLPSTTYHFRVVAGNGTQSTNGPDQTFTTLPPVSIDSTSVTQVNATSADLQAELNPHGVAGEYHFEYDTTPYTEGQAPHGTSVPIPEGSLSAATSDLARSELVQGLVPSTTYYYRVVAHNSLGAVQGPGRSFTTQGSGAVLPDGRQWEMVSPPNKHGAPLQPMSEFGGVLQAAADGGAFAFYSLGPTDTEPQGNRSIDDTQLLAKRGAGGWSTENITTAHEEIAKPEVGSPSEYRLFSEDLSSALLEPLGATPLSSKTTERTPYRREEDGEYMPLLPAENMLAGVKFGGEEFRKGTGEYSGGVTFRTASPDGKHVLLESTQALTSGFKAGFVPTTSSLYELSGETLQLVSVLPGPADEPTAEAGLRVEVGDNDQSMRGAISADGSRVVFGTVGGHLYLRDVSLGQTVKLDEPQPGAAALQRTPLFQGATGDGDKVFFTDEARLTTDATKASGRDLYMCEVKVSPGGQLECVLSDLSVDSNAGERADVQGEVSSFGADGGKVYFAANGVLTAAANARGGHAVPANCASTEDEPCNLYVYDTNAKRIALVAVVSSLDAPDWNGEHVLRLSKLTARSSPSGRYFAFMSERPLTGYDNRDASPSAAGARDEEVFEYDAQSEALRCVSCNPTGARPVGVFDKNQFPGLLVDEARIWPNRWLAGSIPGWTANNIFVSLYQSRYLSDSGRLFFDAADALSPLDTNGTIHGVNDVYEYEPAGVGSCTSEATAYVPGDAGCVNLISAGTSPEESAFLDASENRDEVFFLTASRLVGSDVDGALDVYDAHVCSVSSPCPPPPPTPSPACEGDACQNPVAPPSDATPASLTYKGPGNAISQLPPTKVAVKSLTRAQLLTRALQSCRKKKSKKQRVVCERLARKRYAAKPAKKARGHKASAHERGTR
jgi:hypothetical protein